MPAMIRAAPADIPIDLAPDALLAHPVRAYVGLGANLGETTDSLERALRSLDALPHTCVRQRSRFWRSAPVDACGPDFVNAVAALDTRLAPAALLAALHRIETDHGRTRPYRNAPRTLDLDLLLHGDALADTAALRLPHPRLHERAFVLRPLAEVAPDLSIPGRGPIRSLLAAVAAQSAEPLAPPGGP